MSLKRNATWNLAGTGLPLLLGAAAIPFLVARIGVEAFGILTLIWTLIGYFSLFDFGLGRALTQQVAACLASNQPALIPRLVKSGTIFTTFTGIVGGVVLAVMSHPLGYDWLKVSVDLQAQTALSLFIAALCIPFTTTSAGLRGVLEAYEDFRAVNLLRLMLGVANFGLPVLSVVFFGPSLPYIVVSLMMARIVIFAIYCRLAYNRLPANGLNVKAHTVDIRRLLSFGAWMTVSNVISPIMVSADRFLIGVVLGTSAVAYYTVPFEVLIRVLVIPAALTAALFPRLAATLKVDTVTAKVLYKKSIRTLALTLGPICIALAFGAFWGLTAWLGADFASKSWAIVSVLALGILLNGIAFVPFAAIQAAGDARTTALLHIAQLFVYAPILFLLLHLFGVMGAAMAWVIRAGFDLMLLLIYAKKITGL